MHAWAPVIFWPLAFVVLVGICKVLDMLPQTKERYKQMTDDTVVLCLLGYGYAALAVYLWFWG